LKSLTGHLKNRGEKFFTPIGRVGFFARPVLYPPSTDTRPKPLKSLSRPPENRGE